MHYARTGGRPRSCATAAEGAKGSKLKFVPDVVEEIVEPGASATDDHRPKFRRMMDAASEKPALFETNIILLFSRFFRDQIQLEFYLRRLAKNGVKLTSITQDLGDDPISGMMGRSWRFSANTSPRRAPSTPCKRFVKTPARVIGTQGRLTATALWRRNNVVSGRRRSSPIHF